MYLNLFEVIFSSYLRFVFVCSEVSSAREGTFLAMRMCDNYDSMYAQNLGARLVSLRYLPLISFNLKE